MKTITLKEAFEILENCSAVVTEEHTVIYPGLADLTGEDENEWLNISWTEDGQDFVMIFNEQDNREVKVQGSSLFLVDNECADGEEIQLTILCPQNLEQEKGCSSIDITVFK